MNKLTITILLFLVLIVFQAKADIWDTPGTKIYYSENKAFMLKVVPAISPKIIGKSGSEKEKSKMGTIAKNIAVTSCNATLYKISTAGATVVWKKKLINKICPVTAIVSNDGSSIVTFDNWYSKSYGDDLMVVYNQQGDLKKRNKFEEVSPFPLKDYPQSKASLLLISDQKYIDNDRIEISFQNEKEITKTRIYNVKKLIFEK